MLGLLTDRGAIGFVQHSVHQEIDQTAHHRIVRPADQGRGITLLGDKPDVISVFR